MTSIGEAFTPQVCRGICQRHNADSTDRNSIPIRKQFPLFTNNFISSRTFATSFFRVDLKSFISGWPKKDTHLNMRKINVYRVILRVASLTTVTTIPFRLLIKHHHQAHLRYCFEGVGTAGNVVIVAGYIYRSHWH